MRAADRVTLNTTVLYLKIAVTTVISLYSVRILLEALGAENYGIYNLVAGIVAMLQFLNTSMTMASQRFMSYAHGKGIVEKQKTIFNVSLCIHLIVSVVLVILLELVGVFLFDSILDIPEVRHDAAWVVFQFMVFSTALTILTVPYDAVINAREKLVFYAVVDLISSISKLLIALFLFKYLGDRLILYSLLWTLVVVAELVIKYLYCRRFNECVIHLKKYVNKRTFKELLSFGGWSFLGTGSSMLSMYSVGIILNTFFGVLLNAAQGIANQLSGQLMSLSTTLMKALNPVIVKSVGGDDHERAVRVSLLGNKYSVFLVSMVVIPILIETKFVFSVWLKDVPNYAVIFCQLSLIRSVINQLTATYPTLIGATGKIRNYQIGESVVYLSAIPVAYVVFKLGAVPWAIYVVMIGMVLFLTVVRLFFVKKLCKIRYSTFFSIIGWRVLCMFMLTLFIAYVPTLFLDDGIYRFFLVTSFSLIAGFCMIYSVGIGRSEKEYFTSMFRRVFVRVIK